MAQQALLTDDVSAETTADLGIAFGYSRLGIAFGRGEVVERCPETACVELQGISL